jgi:hypothetical protein
LRQSNALPELLMTLLPGQNCCFFVTALLVMGKLIRIVPGNIAKTRHDTMNEIKFSKRTLPLIPVGHPQFKWTSGADVQATWHRYMGWTPPSGRWLKPIEVERPAPAFLRVK